MANSPAHDFVKLEIGRRPSGQIKWLIALRATANYYGWTEELEPWRPKTHVNAKGQEVAFWSGRIPSLHKAHGHNLRISDSESRRGHPAALTHRFRVSYDCGLRELGKLASVTKQDWHWMAAPSGQRRTRCQWLQIHRLYTS